MPGGSDQGELDAAIAAISDPERLRRAVDLLARAAPALQQVLGSAIAQGGWFDTAHRAALREALTLSEPAQRLRAVDSLIAEETRLAMLVGAAVGFELAHELDFDHDRETNKEV